MPDVGIVCAALVEPPAAASAKATGDGRLAWMSVGTTLALIGLALTLFSQPSLFPGGAPSSMSADAAAARYLLWHVALLAAAAFALAGWAPRLRSLLIFGGLGALLLAWAAVVSTPFGDLASNDGFSPTMRALVASSWPRRPASPSSGGGAPAARCPGRTCACSR